MPRNPLSSEYRAAPRQGIGTGRRVVAAVCLQSVCGHRARLAAQGSTLLHGGWLIIELDGYGSHGNPMAFMYDRHRDYELTLSGYTVLRLANEEIAQDLEKAIDKIRDLVELCRTRSRLEA